MTNENVHKGKNKEKKGVERDREIVQKGKNKENKGVERVGDTLPTTTILFQASGYYCWGHAGLGPGQ